MTPGLIIAESQRLRIRQLCEGDIPHWLAANTSHTRDEAERILAEEMDKPDGPPGEEGKQFIAETPDDGWVGFTGFGAKRDGDAGGYFFVAEHHRGKGYGEELVRLALGVMFRDCGAARCLIDYHDWNEVAHGLYTKLGFRKMRRIRIPEDKLEQEDRARGEGGPVHAVIVELTREEYLAARQPDP